MVLKHGDFLKDSLHLQKCKVEFKQEGETYGILFKDARNYWFIFQDTVHGASPQDIKNFLGYKYSWGLTLGNGIIADSRVQLITIEENEIEIWF